LIGSTSAARLFLAAAFTLLASACDSRTPARGAEAAQVAKPRAGYAQELAALDAAIASGTALSAQRTDDALLPLEITGLYQERARLTGRYDDFARARAVLDAQARGRPAPTFCLAQARLHYTLHRLAQATQALDACPASVERTEIAGLRADIAMYSGRYREAEAAYRALLNQSPLPQNYVRLALLKAKTGAPAEAHALLEAAEKRYHGVSATMKAWLKLQRGLVALDRGRLDEALALYRLAGDALPGWWLVDEHVAEVTLLRGDAAAARTLYADIVERTQSPEFMDALAALEHAAGREAEAKRWTERARPLYEQRMAEFPEAAAGHALDHFLADTANPGRALALAEANFKVRPYGEAAIGLAKASIIAGKAARAATLLEAQLASGWDTAETHWVLAKALDAAGRRAPAAQAHAAALLRNPESDRMYAIP
jgi:hypothetical protein